MIDAGAKDISMRIRFRLTGCDFKAIGSQAEIRTCTLVQGASVMNNRASI